MIRENKASSGIIGERRQPQTRPEEAEYGRKQFITHEVEMSISHSDHTEISQKSDIKRNTQGYRRDIEKTVRL